MTDTPKYLRELATYRDARESTRLVKALNNAADEIECLESDYLRRHKDAVDRYEECLDLKRELAAASAQVEEFRRDAERYRALRNRKDVRDECYLRDGHHYIMELASGSMLDRSLDAALAKNPAPYAALGEVFESVPRDPALAEKLNCEPKKDIDIRCSDCKGCGVIFDCAGGYRRCMRCGGWLRSG